MILAAKARLKTTSKSFLLIYKSILLIYIEIRLDEPDFSVFVLLILELAGNCFFQVQT
jgi:hypothetical protein